MTRSNGELGRVELINGGLLDLSTHSTAAAMTIGSLEGDATGTVRLSGTLSVAVTD